MNTARVAALVAAGLQPQSCQSCRDADAGHSGVRGPAEHHLFNAAVRSDAQLLGDRSPGLQG